MKTKQSRTAACNVPLEIWEAYESNVRRIKEAGWLFERDATGMAYHVISPDHGELMAGPWGACELAAFFGVQALEESRRKAS